MILTKENIVNEIMRVNSIPDVSLRNMRMNDFKLHLFRKSDFMPFKINAIHMSAFKYDELDVLLEDMNGDITVNYPIDNIPKDFYTYDEYRELYENNECYKYSFPYTISTVKNHLTFLQTDHLGMYLYKHDESNKVFTFNDTLLRQLSDPENIDAVCEKMSGEFVEMPKPQ